MDGIIKVGIIYCVTGHRWLFSKGARMDRKIHNVHEGNFIGKLATWNVI